MDDAVSKVRYSIFINFLIFSFPIAIISVRALGDFILILLAVAGIVLVISNGPQILNTKSLRLFSLLTVGYFIVVVLSVVFSGQFSFLAHYIPRDLHFFFAPFIALAIYHAKISMKILLLGVKVGLIVIGLIVIYQNYYGVARPSGVMNADIFGNLAVMMVFLSIAQIFEENNRNKMFTIFASIFGLTAIILSGTRGAWVSFLILMVVYLFLIYPRYLMGNWKLKLIVLLVFVIIIGTAASNKQVQHRVMSAVTQMNQWYDGENKTSSVGIRLEMWKSAINLVKQSPWVGHGYRNTNLLASENASESTMKAIASYNHLHNEYLTSLIAKGVLGLIVVLLILFVPLLQFIKGLKSGENYTELSMGVMLCVGYASFGLVNVMFGDGFMNAFYVFFLAILLPRVMRETACYKCGKKPR